MTNGLYRLAQNQRVVLFIDDIQWLDEGSAAVLKHLRERFAPGSETPLLIVVASRDPKAVTRLEIEDTVLSLTPPTSAAQVGILERSLGIERVTAGQIVNALGIMSQEAGAMFWLMRAVQELVGENAFVPTPRGFVLRPQYARPGQMPVPTGMREKLTKVLGASGEYQPIVECAALLGEKFEIDDLAECLVMDGLKLLQVLRHLEEELQLCAMFPQTKTATRFPRLSCWRSSARNWESRRAARAARPTRRKSLANGMPALLLSSKNEPRGHPNSSIASRSTISMPAKHMLRRASSVVSKPPVRPVSNELSNSPEDSSKWPSRRRG